MPQLELSPPVLVFQNLETRLNLAVASKLTAQDYIKVRKAACGGAKGVESRVGPVRKAECVRMKEQYYSLKVRKAI